MTVCIVASMKFKDKIIEISKILNELNISYALPPMNIPKALETPEMTSKLVFDHFSEINKSEHLLVINPGGYIGNSVKIEIGYAKGVGKKVHFLEKTNQPELDCLADSFVSINELHKLKE